VMCAGRPIESVCPFCFFNDTATTAISTLSLHDALPIYFTTLGVAAARGRALTADDTRPGGDALVAVVSDGLATRLLGGADAAVRSEEHTSELQSPYDLVCRLLLEKKKKKKQITTLSDTG